MKGRIDSAKKIVFDTKRPIILCNSHPLTELIVRSYHLRYGHQNFETVINEIRQRFVINRLRPLLKKIRLSCQECKNRAAQPQPPEMSELPFDRMAAFSRPFTYVGVDYFGPLEVKLGRRIEKRWGVLYTCLTVRAIHIEIAHTLSSDSCIMCTRNFICRRGVPIRVWSDNGTNFRGATTELRQELSHLNQEMIKKEFTEFEWRFIPPGSPHMGGAWERMVRSVKSNLTEVLPNRRPTDELLRSCLLEVENLVNSRPLTHIPIDPEEPEALTPNHFLLGSSSGVKPAGECNDDCLILRKNWRISQNIVDSFWKRWIREVLPELTRRTKWHDPVKPLQIDDVVIIVDPNNRRNTWPMGIIVDTVSGKDGQVRQAVVKTATGLYTRPTVKLAKLDVRSTTNGVSSQLTKGENVVGEW